MKERGVTPNEVFTAYANSTIWTLVHAVQFAGSEIVIFGLLALFFALNVNSGIWGMLNRYAAASAVAALALNAVLYAVDGVGLKQAVDAWVSAATPEKAAYFAVVQGIRGVEWGMRSYVLMATGLSIFLLAIVIILTARIPRHIGYIIGLTGLAQIFGGYGYCTGYTSISGFVTPNVAIYGALIIAWGIWLAIHAWRMKEAVEAPAG